MRDFKIKVKFLGRAVSNFSKPISIAKYVAMHVADNPGTNAAEPSKTLRQLLEA